MDEFLVMNVKRKVDSFQSAKIFLDQRIDSARIKLENSERELLEFARETGIISLDSKLNLTTRQLEELNDALAKAVVARIDQESRYRQAVETNGRDLEEVLNNVLIQKLKEEHARLEAEYRDLGTIFKEDYPKMKRLKAKATKKPAAKAKPAAKTPAKAGNRILLLNGVPVARFARPARDGEFSSARRWFTAATVCAVWFCSM